MIVLTNLDHITVLALNGTTDLSFAHDGRGIDCCYWDFQSGDYPLIGVQAPVHTAVSIGSEQRDVCVGNPDIYVFAAVSDKPNTRTPLVSDSIMLKWQVFVFV